LADEVFDDDDDNYDEVNCMSIGNIWNHGDFVFDITLLFIEY
jgi:hypothetical protein